MTVEFEFLGSRYDGLYAEGEEAKVYYHASYNGTIGRRFCVRPEHDARHLEGGAAVKATLHLYEYEVYERYAAGKVLLIRATFVGIVKLP